MKITIHLDEDLFAEIKKVAAEEETSPAVVVEEALCEWSSRRELQRVRQPVKLPTFCGDGVLPGVDLDSNASLLEHMERDWFHPPAG